MRMLADRFLNRPFGKMAAAVLIKTNHLYFFGRIHFIIVFIAKISRPFVPFVLAYAFLNRHIYPVAGISESHQFTNKYGVSCKLPASLEMRQFIDAFRKCPAIKNAAYCFPNKG